MRDATVEPCPQRAAPRESGSGSRIAEVFPCSAERDNQRKPWSTSGSVPSPSTYMKPRLYWASSCSRSAASRYQWTARAGSLLYRFTNSPVSKALLPFGGPVSIPGGENFVDPVFSKSPQRKV